MLLTMAGINMQNDYAQNNRMQLFCVVMCSLHTLMCSLHTLMCSLHTVMCSLHAHVLIAHAHVLIAHAHVLIAHVLIAHAHVLIAHGHVLSAIRITPSLVFWSWGILIFIITYCFSSILLCKEANKSSRSVSLSS